jgi:large subunit ribosomal protein L17
LILHGRVVTTEVKAKKARPFVEKLITKARKGGLHNRRLAMSHLQDRKIVHRLFDEVGPRAGDRPGGYTRILKLGPRRGDAAPMAILELVDAPTAAPAVVEEEPKRRGRRVVRRRRRRAEAEHEHDHEGHDHEAHEPEEPAPAAEPEPAPAPEPVAEAPQAEGEAAGDEAPQAEGEAPGAEEPK